MNNKTIKKIKIKNFLSGKDVSGREIAETS
jgi:hypothetical protein